MDVDLQQKIRLRKKKLEQNYFCLYLLSIMSNHDKQKSHLLEAVQLAILMDGRTDFELAKAVGNVSVGTICNIRNSKHIPNVLLCERIYETLSGCSLADFDL